MGTEAHGPAMGRPTRLVAAMLVLMVALTACGVPGQQKTMQHDGGLRMTLSVACPTSQRGCDIHGLLAQTRDILQRRAVDGLGVAGAVTRLDGDTAIVVELPAYTQEAQARDVLGFRGEVDFIDTRGTPLPTGADVSAQICVNTCISGHYKIVFTCAQLDPTSLSATQDPQSQQPVVTFAFAQHYKQQFGDYTREHIGQYLTIALDGKVIESATIQSEIDGQGEIIGLRNMDEARGLVTKLKYQALPLAVTISTVEHVPSAPTSAQ